PDETFVLNLQNPVNAGLADGQGAATIVNDDLPRLTINDVSVTEGNAGPVYAVFTVSLAPVGDQPVTVNYATAAGTATAANCVSVVENVGAYAVFTVTLSNVSDRYVTIIYGTTDGTATQDTSDYTAVVGSVLFGPGETVKSVSVPIGGDNIDELDETFFLNL